MSQQKKIALVTGGSRGLGRDMALRLAENGHDVVITYHSNQEEAEKVVHAIKESGQQSAALQLDSSRVGGFKTFSTELRELLKEKFQTEGFDFLINNAGTALYALFADTTEEEFDAVMNIHLKGVFFLTQELLPLLHDGGRIINISSGLARFSFPGSSAYAAMKGAVEVLTRYLAKELGARKIVVNTVAPGAIATDFGGGHVRDNKELNAQIASQTALGRVGEADDIGSVVAFLCSEGGAWVNAQRIEVSGGMMI